MSDLATGERLEVRFEPLGRVRVGLVGAGFMSKLHSFALRTAALRFPACCPPVELTRVADPDERARAAAAAFGWEQAAAGWQEVTRAEDVDLVVVATPVHLHAEVSIDAVAHGKHVLCEKPLAAGVAGARAALDAADAAGRLHATAFAMRHWPAVRAAKRLVDSGELGRLVKVRAHYLLDWALPDDVPPGWRFHRETAGSGSLGDVGSHVLDVVRHLAGDVRSVSASARTIRPVRAGRAIDVDDAADLLLEMDSGVAAVAEVSWMAPGHKTDLAFELIGDEGSLRFSWARNDELQVHSRHAAASTAFEVRPIAPDDEDQAEFAPAPGTPLGLSELFVLQARAVLGALGEGRGMVPDFRDGLRVCEVIEAAQASSAHGRRVVLG